VNVRKSVGKSKRRGYENEKKGGGKWRNKESVIVRRKSDWKRR
jgi:hypothetical protein